MKYLNTVLEFRMEQQHQRMLHEESTTVRAGVAHFRNRQSSSRHAGEFLLVGSLAPAAVCLQALGRPGYEGTAIGFGVLAFVIASTGLALFIDAQRAKRAAEKLESGLATDQPNSDTLQPENRAENQPYIEVPGGSVLSYDDISSFNTEEAHYRPYEAGYTGREDIFQNP